MNLFPKTRFQERKGIHQIGGPDIVGSQLLINLREIVENLVSFIGVKRSPTSSTNRRPEASAFAGRGADSWDEPPPGF